MKIEKKILIPSLLLLIIVIIGISTNLNFLQNQIGIIYDGCIHYFGWLFIFVDICCLIFSIWIMFGKYKDVKLGGENAEPAFNTLSWIGMMFTTSCGAWLIVYGFLEPLYCIAQNAIQSGTNISSSFELGQMYAHFHWGPNAWCIYVPITIAIGLALYNSKKPKATISACIEPITQNNKLGKFLGLCIDIIAVCAAIFAPVISIGTGMPLLTALIQNLFGINDSYLIFIQLSILSIWILLFGTSVYFGLSKGIKRLSNINVISAFIFMGIFGLIIGVIKVFSSEINNIGLLIQNFVRLNTFTDPYGNGGFVNGWTFSYWACYFVYMPLMGVFNAKISKGRKLKEVVFGQLILCSLGCWFAMSTFGNFAIETHLSGKVDVLEYLNIGDEAGAIIALLNTLPYPKIFMFVLLVMSFIFLATTMDSSAFSAAEMTVIQKEGLNFAPRWVRVMWATIAAIIAFIIVQVGGAKAVRSLCYIAGLPLTIIALLIIVSLLKKLKEEIH